MHNVTGLLPCCHLDLGLLLVGALDAVALGEKLDEPLAVVRVKRLLVLGERVDDRADLFGEVVGTCASWEV